LSSRIGLDRPNHRPRSGLEQLQGLLAAATVSQLQDPALGRSILQTRSADRVPHPQSDIVGGRVVVGAHLGIVASAPIDPTPLDAPCEPLSGDSHAHLRERLADWCRSELGYNVEIRPVARPTGGWCDTKARAIVVDATGAPNAQLRTLIHETAHAMVVDYRSHSRERAEVIVDSVIFSSGWLESSMAAGLHVGDGCYRGTSGSAIRRGCSGRRRGSALLLVSLPKTS
jgi:hypothetical protein